MPRLLLALVALLALGASAASAADTVPADPQMYVEKFNPDIFALKPDGTPQHPMSNAFASPASDIAEDVSRNNWFNLFVYLPFLIAPQFLLLVVIFRYRDRGDGRKPATFMTNHKLEALWTIIPILALVIVSVPVAKVLYKMELPPEAVDTNDPRQATVVKITGHQFWWEYEYKAENLAAIGHDVGGGQEPIVLAKGRAVLLNITSADVNHAWWVASFGVKKDAIRGRYTNCWFTPKILGVFKGNCAELCGPRHGMMFISAVVVTPEEFEVYKLVERDRADASRVWNVLQPAAGPAQDDDGKLRAAVDRYFEKDRSEGRRFALRYWVATNYQALHRSPDRYQAMSEDLKAHEDERKRRIETLIAALPRDEQPLAAKEQE
jgi:cytochrome c oxidase subunit 2